MITGGEQLPEQGIDVRATWLFRHRDRLVAAWGLLAVVLSWPPRGWLPSLVPLLAGVALRLWARAHIGPHSRGRILASPERCAGGPYRILAHPLYAANLLSILALALSLVGPSLSALLVLAGPAALYAVLARAETRRLRALDPPVRTTALPRSERRLRSEWASIAPPSALWLLFQIASRP